MHRYVPMTGWFSNVRPSRFKARRRFCALAVASVLIAGCTVGPKYVKPATEVPSSYKETAQNFKEAQPSDQIGKGKWWEIYNDAQLNDLEEQIRVSNQTLKAAQAQFEAARAAIRVAHSQAFPNITGGVSGTHNSESFNRPLSNTNLYYQDYVLPVDVSYEPDLWGRVRRLVEANRSEAQATAADLANVDLSLHAELAVDYFQLRGLDAQKKLLDSTVESYTRALELTQSRYHGGVATAVDVAQAQTQLETTRAQAIDVEANRAAFEHAIAVAGWQAGFFVRASAAIVKHAAPARSAGSAVRPARAKARYCRSRKACGRSERTDRRGESSLLSQCEPVRRGRL